MIPYQGYADLFKNPNVTKDLHVGSRGFSFRNALAQEHLKEEFTLDVRPMVEKVLESYRVMIYW